MAALWCKQAAGAGKGHLWPHLPLAHHWLSNGLGSGLAQFGSGSKSAGNQSQPSRAPACPLVLAMC